MNFNLFFIKFKQRFKINTKQHLCVNTVTIISFYNMFAFKSSCNVLVSGLAELPKATLYNILSSIYGGVFCYLGAFGI